MEVFRISTKQYAEKLMASGAENRWNLRGEYVIYTGASRSLSTLELTVHLNAIQPNLEYKVMVTHIPDDDSLVRTIKTTELPLHWRNRSAYSTLQKLGSDWINSRETLVLKVPSAVIPKEYNYIINTEHPDFKRVIKLVSVEDYFWDQRLR